MPHIVFGNCYDAKNVVPAMDDPNAILSRGLDVTSDERDEAFYSQFIYAMKQWYAFRTKGSLQKIMDYAQVTGMKLYQYGTLVNLKNEHWIYF